MGRTSSVFHPDPLRILKLGLPRSVSTALGRTSTERPDHRRTPSHRLVTPPSHLTGTRLNRIGGTEDGRREGYLGQRRRSGLRRDTLRWFSRFFSVRVVTTGYGDGRPYGSLVALPSRVFCPDLRGCLTSYRGLGRLSGVPSLGCVPRGTGTCQAGDPSRSRRLSRILSLWSSSVCVVET